MLSTSIRAIAYDRYGPPEVLRETTLPKPVPAPGEVLVRMRALSVNGGELAMRAGRLLPFSGKRFPKTIGLDLVGEVVEPGSSRFAPGELVWGAGRSMNTAAEYVAVPADRIDHVPAGLDPVRAAALPVGTTAITALRDKARLKPGERLLVRGATGGVGYVAVQLGKAMGAHVTGLTSAKNLDLATELGADVALDYRNPGELGRFDVILDTVGSDPAAFRRLLTRRGRMVAISFDLDHPVRTLGYLAAHSPLRTRWVRFFSGNPKAELFAELSRWVTAGAIRPVVDRVFPLSELAKAHQALEDGGVRGKVVVEVS
ncbi:NAD(P)-dependent alcohol dehydrogenase [Amycolatopsis benzoatilytica]|uniref:NAD(P)-dependent alcohol dehydrogenase n=1 Tax=Amycolatopsis benzoatilytica TaxID=346045 RepID=UPI00036911CD|nr:NAD(P)-dependent alcohol dehydrogenase [Amycolatopsis benzoatilytica]